MSSLFSVLKYFLKTFPYKTLHNVLFIYLFFNPNITNTGVSFSTSGQNIKLKKIYFWRKYKTPHSPQPESGLTHPNAAFIESAGASSLRMHSSWFTNQQCRLMKKKKENKLDRPYIYSIINPPYPPRVAYFAIQKMAANFWRQSCFLSDLRGEQNENFFFLNFCFLRLATVCWRVKIMCMSDEVSMLFVI